MNVPLHLLGSDYSEHFFSRVGGMKGFERNYNFADLVSCASGLNKIGSMEYGEENIRLGRSHAKQQTIWGKLHPVVARETEPDLSDFSKLCTDAEITEALKKRSLEVTPEALESELDEGEPELADLNATGDLWDLASPVLSEGPKSELEDDGADDLAVAGHETRHVMSEVFHELCSDEQQVKKFDPMVSYDGHSIYKATLVSHVVGNPTLSKDRLTRIKQSIYFNGVKQKPRVDGVPVCILDIGSDCAVFFKSENTRRSKQAKDCKFSRQRGLYWEGPEDP
ncbi:hypothetical protein R1sor_016305 [Riccia sorocarpa]|uniref:Uncharacterized protein n=1 Tax=Riccia sorocarpa TaxID=122646 RepID=A0ABD3HIM7_9MARC